MQSAKSIHTIVLDTGAIIRNHPTVSSLIAQAEEIVTVPAIISEIRDATTRSRVETTLMPFLKLRTPTPQSIKFVSDFARRTGDLAVLSKPDIQIIALAYEVECEHNGGDWRLRRTPGQKGVNGSPPKKDVSAEQTTAESVTADGETAQVTATTNTEPAVSDDKTEASAAPAVQPVKSDVDHLNDAISHSTLNDTFVSSAAAASVDRTEKPSAGSTAAPSDDEDDDDEGWITPSNLKKHQAKDASGSIEEQGKEPSVMQVATLTTDYAMQNVILQINLNLLSPSFQRVKHLKTFVLRCHACFQTTKDMQKQFCPRCGKPSLTRVACSTSSNGEFKLHLKKNMQWNTRGDRYSIPKAVSGSANGRVQGGGKGGWGNGLILAEDQKEYQRAVSSEKRSKERDLMDADYLPSILTGERGRTGGRIQVGAGRNVNSKKR